MPNNLHSEMFMRARAMRAYANAGAEPPAAVAEVHERDKLLVQQLPHPHQEIVWLRCVEGLNWDEIAKATFYSKSTAADYNRRGIKMLEEIINGKQG